MKFKNGVKIFGCSPQILSVLPIADAIWKELGAEAWVTSGSEQTSKHSRSSLHYSGNALDFRTRNLFMPGKACSMLKNSLTDEFDVILEVDHLHVEFQAKHIVTDDS